MRLANEADGRGPECANRADPKVTGGDEGGQRGRSAERPGGLTGAAAVALGSQRPLTHPVTASAEALPATVALHADATTLPFNATGMPGATAGPHELTVANLEATPRR